MSIVRMHRECTQSQDLNGIPQHGHRGRLPIHAAILLLADMRMQASKSAGASRDTLLEPAALLLGQELHKAGQQVVPAWHPQHLHHCVCQRQGAVFATAVATKCPLDLLAPLSG